MCSTWWHITSIISIESRGKDSCVLHSNLKIELLVTVWWWRLWHAFRKKKKNIYYYTSLLAIQAHHIHTHTPSYNICIYTKHVTRFLFMWTKSQPDDERLLSFLVCASCKVIHKMYITHIFWMNHSILMKCSRISLVLMPLALETAL